MDNRKGSRNLIHKQEKTHKEERRLVDTFSEFYLSDRADIETFIHMFAVNAENFSVEEFFVDLKKN